MIHICKFGFSEQIPQWSLNFSYIRKFILPRCIKSTRCIIAHYFTIIKSFKLIFAGFIFSSLFVYLNPDKLVTYSFES